MLVKVSVENFKSFDKAAELTMISTNKIRQNPNPRLKLKSTQLLKYALVNEQMHLERPIWHCSLNFLKIVSAMVFR